MSHWPPFTPGIISPPSKSYFIVLGNLEVLKKGSQLSPDQVIGLDTQIRGAEESLENLGMSKAQIKELAQKRQVSQDIFLTAPVTSFVLSRNISPGLKFSKGDELYKLADLSRVWILADIYENEARFITPGLKVRVTLPYQDKTLWATVTDIIPEFDKVSKTLKVRLEADNPDYSLRPDMFVDVEFPINLPAAVNVPVDAVLDSGLKKTVFVDRGNGFFEPRKVESGWRFGDRMEITQGLQPGERIVVSGNFLIDSESRMKLAAAGLFGEVARDPVCGVNLEEGKAKAAGHQSQYQGKTYIFCSEECKHKFTQHPERYAEKPGAVRPATSTVPGDIKPEAKGPESKARTHGDHKPAAQPAMIKDPVCGMDLDEGKAKAAGHQSQYQGKTYLFCSEECKDKFTQHPESYAEKPGAVRPATSTVPVDIKPEAKGPESKAHTHGDPKSAAILVKDPVCGLDVDPVKAAANYLKRDYQGKTYYFCRSECAQQFDQDPGRWTSKILRRPNPARCPDCPGSKSHARDGHD